MGSSSSTQTNTSKDPSFGYLGEWLHYDHLVSSLAVGDLIEYDQSWAYKHWAVYIGPYKNFEHCVIHYFGVMNKENGKLEIRHGELKDTMGEHKCRINNSFDKSEDPFDKEIIVERATKCIGLSDYNVLDNNCEHFSKWCRNGICTSGQSFMWEAQNREARAIRMMSEGSASEDFIQKVRRDTHLQLCPRCKKFPK